MVCDVAELVDANGVSKSSTPLPSEISRNKREARLHSKAAVCQFESGHHNKINCQLKTYKNMEVICVNDQPIKQRKNGKLEIAYGTGLKKGEVYRYSRIETGVTGDKCYFIAGLGLKKCIRFKHVLSDDFAEEVLSKIENKQNVHCHER